MNILVCFKICSELSKLNPKDFEIKGEVGMDTHFLPNMINCFDESSLEFGIRLSENTEGLTLNVEKTALTIGEEHTEQYLKTLIALGYDHAVRVRAKEEEIRYSPSDVAATISEYNKRNKQDIIITGRQAPHGNNASTGQIVSALTGYPLFSSVVDIKIDSENELILTILNNGSIYEQKVHTPAVISMGNAVISCLRTPTLRQRMKTKNKQIEYFELIKNNKIQSIEPYEANLPDRKRKGYVSNFDGKEAVDDIMKQYLSERLGEI